jgi:protein gp37
MTGWPPDGGIDDRVWMPPWPLPNVWVGTSIENEDYVWRADELRRVPAAIRFLSLEPLLGPLSSLDLTGNPQQAPASLSGDLSHAPARLLGWGAARLS